MEIVPGTRVAANTACRRESIVMYELNKKDFGTTPDYFVQHLDKALQMGEESYMKKKMSIGFVLAIILLAATITAVAATLWPSFIKERFTSDEPTAHVGILALIDQVKGIDLSESVEVEDVSMRLHYAIVDGSECVVLFSLQNSKPNMQSVEDRIFIAEADFQAENGVAAGGRCNITEWYDEVNGTLYCLGSTPLEGGDLPAESDVKMTLSVITEAPVESQDFVFAMGDPIWSITTTVPVSNHIASIAYVSDNRVSFGKTTLTLTEIDLRPTGATVKFEGSIEPSDEGQSRSLMRMFGFEWTSDGKVQPLTLSGAAFREIDGIALGELTFLGTFDEMPGDLLLKVWKRDNPNDVQCLALRLE